MMQKVTKYFLQNMFQYVIKNVSEYLAGEIRA